MKPPVDWVYGPDGTPIERLGNAKADTRWLGHDTQHSITLATDDSANVTTTNTYTPWGAVRAHTGETINLGYDAQYTDPETGFIYLRVRYYDPATAQFLTRDPIEPLTRTTYGYVNNNPLNGSDPTGLATCLLGQNPNGACRGSGVLSAAMEAWNAWCGMVVSNVSYGIRLGYQNRGLVFTTAAIGVCLVPGWGLAACGLAAGIAFAARSSERIEAQGFRDSLGENLADGALTYLTFGFGGAIEEAGVGIPPALAYAGRFLPACYDLTLLHEWLHEHSHLAFARGSH